MKASELRLGNLLNYVDQTVYVLGVRQCTEFMLPRHNLELGYFKDSIGFERSEFDENIQPIPLTEEWLLKFGFGRASETDWIWAYKGYHHFRIDFDEGIGGIDGYRNSYREFNYVHQLQNLYFALVGEELTVKE